MSTEVKDPDAELDYSRTYFDPNDPEDELESSEWFIEDDDETLEVVMSGDHAPSFEGMSSKVWLRGGVAGRNYTVTNRFSTVGGRTDDKSFTLLCRQK